MNTPIPFALSLGAFTFLLTVIWGSPFIEVLKRYKIGKRIRIEEPEAHFFKMGTPTMGGLLVVFPVAAITTLLNLASLVRQVTGRSILLPLGIMLAFGFLGAIDDWEGIHGARKGDGMKGRIKFAWQLIIAGTAALILYFLLDIHSVAIPTIRIPIDLGLIYIPVAIFIIVGSSNAINFTDGLDGQAGLVSATCFAAYGLIAMLQGQIFLMQFCFTMVGALLGF